MPNTHNTSVAILAQAILAQVVAISAETATLDSKWQRIALAFPATRAAPTFAYGG